MEFKELVRQARSFRRFQQQRPVSMDVLLDVIDTARLIPSTSNAQPLRYAVSASAEMNARLYPLLRWAKTLKTWPGPAEGERPAAYIVIGADVNSLRPPQVDEGIAAQTIQLGLAAQGIGCCMLGDINPKGIHKVVGFPDDVAVLLVLAIGYPAETVVLKELEPGQGVAYWRDEQGTHYVPKRRLEDVVLAKFA